MGDLVKESGERPTRLSSELGTDKTVTARFWPWHSGKVRQPFQVVLSGGRPELGRVGPQRAHLLPTPRVAVDE